MKLKHTANRVVVMVDTEFKNSHRFEDGTKIRLERAYNNFNLREARPVNAIVVSAENIPEGAEILINHNSTHETNRITNFKPLSGAEIADTVRYFSLPIEDCYAWRDLDGTMKPIKDFEFGLRVFTPYRGLLQGIEPKLIPDTLYVTTGHLKGLVVRTLKAADYEIVYQETETGKEARLIRFRHSEDEIEKEEITCIDNDLTDKLNNGDLLVGLTPTDAKQIENVCQPN